MKKYAMAVVLTSCITATQAFAAPVTVEYKAVVNTLFETSNVIGGGTSAVQTSNVTGFAISRGETITGYFSYDTSTPLEYRGGDSVLGYFYALTGQFTQSLKFENSPSPITYSYNFLTTELYASPYYISAQSRSANYLSQAWVLLQHPGPVDVANGYLPAADQWSGFGGDSYLEFLQEADDQKSFVRLKADITSFRVLSAVPEPSGYLMLGAGLSLLAFAGRRRRTWPDLKARNTAE